MKARTAALLHVSQTHRRGSKARGAEFSAWVDHRDQRRRKLPTSLALLSFLSYRCLLFISLVEGPFFICMESLFSLLLNNCTWGDLYLYIIILLISFYSCDVGWHDLLYQGQCLKVKRCLSRDGWSTPQDKFLITQRWFLDINEVMWTCSRWEWISSQCLYGLELPVWSTLVWIWTFGSLLGVKQTFSSRSPTPCGIIETSLCMYFVSVLVSSFLLFYHLSPSAPFPPQPFSPLKLHVSHRLLFYLFPSSCVC